MPRPGQGVAEPPLDVGDGRRAERPQPGADQLRSSGFRRGGTGALGEPVRRGGPSRPGCRPCAVVGAADDIAAHRQHGEHPRGQRSVSAPTLSRCRIVCPGEFGQGRAQFSALVGPLSARCASTAAQARSSHRSLSGATPAFCTSATNFRRSLSATLSLAAAWMSGRSSTPTTHNVRRIARCLTSVRCWYRARSRSVTAKPGSRAHSDRYGVAGSVACSPTRSATALSIESAGSPRKCRRASRARRSASVKDRIAWEPYPRRPTKFGIGSGQRRLDFSTTPPQWRRTNEGNTTMNRVVAGAIGLLAGAALMVGCSDDKAATSTSSRGGRGDSQASRAAAPRSRSTAATLPVST